VGYCLEDLPDAESILYNLRQAKKFRNRYGIPITSAEHN
jgi:hypothetical protein